MTFKEMKVLDSGLGDLERRMIALKNVVHGYYALGQDDFIALIGAFTACFPDRESLCVSKVEAAFTNELLRMVGPNAWHPLLKDPELYGIAHAHLWRNFPTCGRECGCQQPATV